MARNGGVVRMLWERAAMSGWRAQAVRIARNERSSPGDARMGFRGSAARLAGAPSMRSPGRRWRICTKGSVGSTTPGRCHSAPLRSWALLSARVERARIFPTKCQRNPLKRLTSDERIQGNPNKSNPDKRRFPGEKGTNQGTQMAPPDHGARRRQAGRSKVIDQNNSVFYWESRDRLGRARFTPTSAVPPPSPSSPGLWARPRPSPSPARRDP